MAEKKVTKKKSSARKKPAASKAVASKKPAGAKKPATGKKAAAKRPGGAIGSSAVEAKTGKTWEDWFRILDRRGAKKMSHKEIVAIVREYPGVTGWWQQSVTVTYEQARGLREKHQTSDGYAVSASKTVAAAADAAFRAWANEDLRARWLEEEAFVVRKATPGKSLRITWIDGRTHLDVYFHEKPGGKTQVSLQHRKLKGLGDVDRLKTYWRARLEAYQAVVEGL